MPRPKNSCPKSYKAIFSTLFKTPKHYSQIIEDTGLHRNTVSSKLKYLVENGFLIKYRNGRKMIYAIPLDRSNDFKWIRQWAELMNIVASTEHIKIIFQFNEELIMAIVNEAYREMMLKRHHKEIMLVESQKFLKYAHDKDIEITLNVLLKNLKSPFCPECLKQRGKLIQTIFDHNLEVNVCNVCGLEFTYNELIHSL